MSYFTRIILILALRAGLWPFKSAPCGFITWGYPYSSRIIANLNKKTQYEKRTGFIYLNLAMSYFHMANATLSSAQNGFTSEFEKGSGGARSLWSPENWSEYRESFDHTLFHIYSLFNQKPYKKSLQPIKKVVVK